MRRDISSVLWEYTIVDFFFGPTLILGANIDPLAAVGINNL
jgi:hypothetical protein